MKRRRKNREARIEDLLIAAEAILATRKDQFPWSIPSGALGDLSNAVRAIRERQRERT